MRGFKITPRKKFQSKKIEKKKKKKLKKLIKSMNFDDEENILNQYIYIGQIIYIFLLILILLFYRKNIVKNYNITYKFLISYIFITFYCQNYSNTLYKGLIYIYIIPSIVYYGIFIHITNYLSYKSKLRAAIQKYRKTGQKVILIYHIINH